MNCIMSLPQELKRHQVLLFKQAYSLKTVSLPCKFDALAG